MSRPAFATHLKATTLPGSNKGTSYLHALEPVLAIELDEKSHQRKDRKDRDAFVDQVFQAAALPLLHVPAAKGDQLEASYLPT